MSKFLVLLAGVCVGLVSSPTMAGDRLVIRNNAFGSSYRYSSWGYNPYAYYGRYSLGGPVFYSYTARPAYYAPTVTTYAAPGYTYAAASTYVQPVYSYGAYPYAAAYAPAYVAPAPIVTYAAPAYPVAVPAYYPYYTYGGFGTPFAMSYGGYYGW